MSRSERLLALLQVLRAQRSAVSGPMLAAKTGVSLRTLYRDIASLQAQGAAIEGAPGVGYVMQPGFMLPPLMFDSDELDALVLGMRLVAAHGDPALANKAAAALAKVGAVLPPERRRELDASPLLIGAGRKKEHQTVDVELLRQAIRTEYKLHIGYLDPQGDLTQRVVWPFALVYFELTRVLMCWCELRGGFRNFRVDRIGDAAMLADRYPRNKQTLLKEWRRTEHVAGRSILPETDSIPS